MYLSTQNNFKLDRIVKSFEVAYRSKIADSLITKYPTLNDFSIAINFIASKLTGMPVIFTKKLKLKADKIVREVGSHYNKIEDCYRAYVSQDYQNEVPYVSDLLDYVNLFFNECFSTLASNFPTIEEFTAQSVKYYNIRNTLSHPASTKIKIKDARDAISFMSNVTNNIEDNKFWYVNKSSILELINEFYQDLDNSVLKVHNLDEVSFPQGKIVCRDEELGILKSFLFGKEKSYRKSGSVVIFGYGGVGKTALVLEFVSQISKDIGDNKIATPYEFILFFTSKEEVLSFKQTSGEVYIESVKKQIGSFEEFEQKMKAALNLGGIPNLNESRGLIVIDNFETLPGEDKIKFIEFIKQTPRTVQYILTSRNEEYCEDKLNLKEFKDLSKGVDFISQYIKTNEIKLASFFPENLKKELVELSKGNTLIIVLTIQQLVVSDSIKKVLGELRSIESANMEIIADFMYKNTIDYTIHELEGEGQNPVKVLKILSLYGEIIDLYSISILAELTVSEVEKICQVFSSRLVLDRIGESFIPNEFANRFILLKYLPNNVEKRTLSDKIRERKRILRKQADDLEITKRKDTRLRMILDDWKPKHIIDKIAIAESDSLVVKVDGFIRDERIRDGKLKRVLEDLDRIEKMTSHPYIRMQRSRILMKIYEIEKDPDNKKRLSEEIVRVYDEAIMSIKYNYSFITHTKSFASINWRYGLIYVNVLKDLSNGARYMEDAVEVFRNIGVFDRTYYLVLNDLSGVYYSLYKSSKDLDYLDELRKVYNEIKKNQLTIKKTDFNVNRYLNHFSRLVKPPFTLYKKK